MSLAARAAVRGHVQGVGFRDAIVGRAVELGLTGWVRNGEDGAVLVHAEGEQAAVEGLVAFLHAGPPQARVGGVEIAAIASEIVAQRPESVLSGWRLDSPVG